MKRLEGLRLEVDSRRRTVMGLRQAIDGKQSKAQTPKGEFQTEQLIRKMQHKENKLASARHPAHGLSTCTPRLNSSSVSRTTLLPRLGWHAGWDVQHSPWGAGRR